MKNFIFPDNTILGHSSFDAKMNLVQNTEKKILIHKNVNCVNFEIDVRIQILVFKN